MITLPAALQITSEKVATLRPGTMNKVLAWLQECQKAGLNLYVYEGYRTCKRQTELYAIGRTVQHGAPKVTSAGPGQSMHNFRLAIDFVPLVEHFKAAGLYEAAWHAEKIYTVAHSIAPKHGLRRLEWETPHLEDADCLNWREARATYGNPCE